METRSIDPNLFQLVPVPRLFGGRERASGRLVFPLPLDGDAFDAEALPPRGTLWSFTIQRMAPKSPPYRGREPFEPFAVGYVELPGALIIESRICGIAFPALRIGLSMELDVLPLYTDADGADVVTYAFRPVREASW